MVVLIKAELDLHSDQKGLAPNELPPLNAEMPEAPAPAVIPSERTAVMPELTDKLYFSELINKFHSKDQQKNAPVSL